MSDQLHQINITYLPVEDRLMMRINTRQGDEFRLWLTRRFTGILLDLLNKEIDKHGGIPILASNTETKNMFKQGAMEKPYENEKVVDLPLGETGILACKINYKTSENGVMVLEMLPDKGKGITLNMNKSLLFMFYNLLMQGCAQSGWRLPAGDQAEGKVH